MGVPSLSGKGGAFNLTCHITVVPEGQLGPSSTKADTERSSSAVAASSAARNDLLVVFTSLQDAPAIASPKEHGRCLFLRGCKRIFVPAQGLNIFDISSLVQSMTPLDVSPLHGPAFGALAAPPLHNPCRQTSPRSHADSHHIVSAASHMIERTGVFNPKETGHTSAFQAPNSIS